MSAVKKTLLSVCTALCAASCGLLCMLCVRGLTYGVKICIACVLAGTFAVVFIYITDTRKPPVFAALYISAILICGPFLAAAVSIKDSLLFSSAAMLLIIAVLIFIWLMTVKASRAIFRSQTHPQRSAGTSLFRHVISFMVTILCSLILIFLVNFRLYLREVDFLTSGLLAGLAGRAALSGSGCFLITVFCVIAIILLLAADALIYRRAVRKIFEHYSVVFISAGGISLLFMTSYSQRLFYFMVSMLLLAAGAVLMLFYILAYHAQLPAAKRKRPIC